MKQHCSFEGDSPSLPHEVVPSEKVSLSTSKSKGKRPLVRPLKSQCMASLKSKEFWMFCKLNPYVDPQQPSMLNNPFWIQKQLSIFNDILKPRENLYVPHVKSIDVEHMQHNERYFRTALSLCEKMGMLGIIQFNTDFDVELIAVFFAMVHLGTDGARNLQWMTNGRLLSTP
ncbi:hypothetical protein D1007_47998 [Hordeum vulgare]|nr:hypothetical protein D1007_47998 [Hordeum vulgare]